MTHTTTNPLPFPMAKASATLIAVVAFVGAGAYGLLVYGIGQPAQARLCVMGGAVSLLIGLTGLMPVWLMSGRHAHGSAYGFLISILVRCVVGFLAVAWLRWGSGLADAETLLMWVAGWYMLVLAVEVKVVSSHVLTATGASLSITETH